MEITVKLNLKHNYNKAAAIRAFQAAADNLSDENILFLGELAERPTANKDLEKIKNIAKNPLVKGLFK